MKYSQLLIPTVKEVPAEAEVASHQLMIRAGFIRKLASGTYTYMPLGQKMLKKVIAIIRQEMDAAGAQEILMPVLQPIELWQQTGRETDYGPTMCKFTDRHGRVNALAPTAEEVVTSLVAAEISSYKQLPVNLYQINTKFRDEFRPRFGVLRSREFIMKDAYSFDADIEGLDKSYQKMYEAYKRIFKRCGLNFVIVEAESGPIGGSASHEFMVPCQAGEDIIVHTADGSYAANIEKAQVDPPATRATGAPPVSSSTSETLIAPNDNQDACGTGTTGVPPVSSSTSETLVAPNDNQDACGTGTTGVPPVSSSTSETLVAPNENQDACGTGTTGVPPVGNQDDKRDACRTLEEVHTPNVGSIDAVCNFLGTTPQQMIKTLIFSASFAEPSAPSRHEQQAALPPGQKRTTAVACLIRGDHEINENKLTHALGATHVELAGESVVTNITNAAVGFAGPVGIVGKVGKMLIDPSVAAMCCGITGANKTDFHVKNVVPGRDFPLSGGNVLIADIRNAAEGDTYQGAPLKFSRGIEIGHVFKLGTKYSDKLGAKFADASQQDKPCIMGCYGIGVNRILASAIESDGGHDENGCILPPAIAPFEIEIVPLNYEKPEVAAEADRIYIALAAAGIDVLLDDRDARPGVKFKDADLLGIPVRIVVGEKGLKEGKVELKGRTEPKATLVPQADVVTLATAALNEMKNV